MPFRRRRAATRRPRFPRLGPACVAALLCVAACDRHPAPPGEPARPARPAHPARPPGVPASIPSDLAALLADAGSGPDGGHGAAERTLAEIRERSLDLPPRRVPAERLVFAKGRLGQLTDDSLVVRAGPTGKTITTIPVPGPRGAIALVDGSLLVAGATSLYRLDAKSKAPATLPHVTLFAGSVLLPDRRDKDAFWVLHEIDPTLYRYDISDAAASVLLAPADFVPLEGYDASAFLALADGSFVYTTKDGFHRFFPHGKGMDYPALDGPGKVWRLLATRRQDRMWVIWSGGEAELVQIGAKLSSVSSFQFEGKAFDVASNNDQVAFVRFEQETGKARKWSLVVYDHAGKKRLEAPLPDDPPVPSGEDWVGKVTRDRCLALAPDRALVAVGGPDAALLWDVDSGKQILGADAAP